MKKENDSGAAFSREQIVVGRNPVMELLKSGREIEKIYIQRGEREGSIIKIFALAKNASVPIAEADRRRLDELSGGSAHQGVAAVAAAKEYSEIEDILKYAAEKNEKPFIVVCDGIEDPHNMGAVIRSAECAGVHGIVISKRHAPVIGPTVFKSSAGAAEYMRIAKVSNIASAVDTLKKNGVWVFAAEAGEDVCFGCDFDTPCAIVLGGEDSGISRLVKEKCDFTVSIPLYGKVNSLNVSAAAAVVLFEAVRSRHYKK